jgi:O-antigen/teichoic acid export membrane protein
VFALCFQISLVLDLVVIGVGAALATHSAGSEAAAPAAAMRVWLQVLAVVTLGAVALIAVAPFLLAALGRFYEGSDGVTVIILLAAGSVLRTSFEIWGATLRARQRTTVVLICTAVFAAAVLPLVLVLTPRLGAVGAAAALLLVTVVLGIAGVVGLLRPVLAARRPSPAGAARTEPVPAGPAHPETGARA